MKFYYYVIILVGILTIFLAAGYDDTPFTGGLAKSLNLINSDGGLSPEEIKNSDLWSGDEDSVGNFQSLYLVLGALALTGLVVSFFGKSPDISYILAAIVWVISGLIVADYVALYLMLSSGSPIWIKWTLGAIMSVLLTGFFITVIEFWRGTD